MFRVLHRKTQETGAFLTRQFVETDKKFKETDALLTRQFVETNKQFKETDKQFRKTDKKLNRLSELFEGQWGKLIETLFEGDALRLFQERGVQVNEVHQRLKSRMAGNTI